MSLLVVVSMKLREDIIEFRNSIPSNVSIVAATKYVGPDLMKELYQSGIHDFGENRVEPFLEKYEALKDLDVKWHFIGHLQRNKCKQVINKIDVLHSLDSLKLAKMIDDEREKPLDCFIEVSINLEENKNGVPFMDIDSFMEGVLQYKNIHVVGFMMMAIKGDTEDDIYNQFKALADLKDKVEKKFNITLPYLSMGMSEDYPMAIKAGSTHVRLGRVLWTN